MSTPIPSNPILGTLKSRDYGSMGAFDKESTDIFMNVVSYLTPAETAAVAATCRRMAVASVHDRSPLTVSKLRAGAWNGIAQATPKESVLTPPNGLQCIFGNETHVAWTVADETRTKTFLRFRDKSTHIDSDPIEISDWLFAIRAKDTDRLIVFPPKFSHTDSVPFLLIDTEKMAIHGKADIRSSISLLPYIDGFKQNIIHVYGTEELDQPLQFIASGGTMITWNPSTKACQDLQCLPDDYVGCSVTQTWKEGDFVYFQGSIKEDPAARAGLGILGLIGGMVPREIFISYIDLKTKEKGIILQPTKNFNSVASYGGLLFIIGNNEVTAVKGKEAYKTLKYQSLNKPGKLASYLSGISVHATKYGVLVPYQLKPIKPDAPQTEYQARYAIWNPWKAERESDISPFVKAAATGIEHEEDIPGQYGKHPQIFLHEDVLFLFGAGKIGIHHIPTRNTNIAPMQVGKALQLEWMHVTDNTPTDITLHYFKKGTNNQYLRTYHCPAHWKKMPQLQRTPKPGQAKTLATGAASAARAGAAISTLPIALTNVLLKGRVRILSGLSSLLSCLKCFFEALKKFFCCVRR